MKKDRKEAILELIEKYPVRTQKQMAQLLIEEGFDITQATVSRDMSDLDLIKTTKNGISGCYAVRKNTAPHLSERFSKILAQTIQSVKAAENLIVINTLAGCANAAAEALDSAQYPQILGTIAGDNTIFVAIDSKDHVNDVLDRLNEVIGKQ